MRTRHDFPVAWRLGAAFALVCLVMAVLGAFVFVTQERSARAEQEFTTWQIPLSDAATRLESAILYVGIGVRTYMLNPGEQTRTAAMASVQAAREALRRLGQLARASGEAREIEALAPPVEGYLDFSAGLLDGVEGEDAAAVERQLSSARERALAGVRQFDAAQDRKLQEGVEALERERTGVARALALAFALVLGILLFVGFYTFRAIQRPTAELVRIARAMQAGDWKPALEWSPEVVAARGDRPNPRSELARIAHAFGSAAVALDRREARLRGDARVAAATASSLRAEAIAQSALVALLDGSAARAGVFYAVEGDARRTLAAHQVSEEDARRFDEQGLPARVARERRMALVQPVPADAALRLSGGHGEPAAIAVIPVVFQDEPLAIVALALARAPDDDARDFLQGAASQVAIGLANARAHERMRQLLEEIQAQNEEIQAQVEEIQAQGEQLQAQNEELQSQQEQIAESNDRLRRQAGELTHADERKNEFLGLLAHELRNPLAAISNSIFMLGHPGVQPAQAAKARAVIERQMKHLTRMIDDLLDVTRISRGKLRLQREGLDLAQLVRDCVEDHRRAIENAGLELRIEVPPEKVPVFGDRTRLGQVLSNLLNNAVKFTERGGRIEVRVEREPAQARLRVIDTGIGIDGELLQQLFEPFSQGESAHTRPNAGLGLGLALARALVEMHGGGIEAHSAGRHAGSEFVVTLPLEGIARPVDGRAFVDAGRRRDGIVSEDYGSGAG
ncbi:MAG TPA: GAF domain-containing sensor histidine kinase [Usitatibacter sp.]|nr:GAF domain-containing sensor histidine kinase [Usitatibacter sp.]